MRKHFAIVAVLAGPGTREAATADPQAGEVLALFGQCFIEIAGRRNALKPGDAVHVGDTLDVTAGAKLKLRMNDVSVIAVASGTRLAQVGVLDGRVSLKSVTTGREIVIPARWGARVEAGRDPVPARVWTEAEFADFIGRTNLE